MIHKRHVASPQGVRGETAVFYDSPSDLWTPGYDQFGNSCWRNNVTLELHYFDTPPGQSPAFPPPAFAGDPYHPHLPIGRSFEYAVQPPAERLPSWELGKKVRFQTPALNLPEPAAAKGWTAPVAKDARPVPPFPPNNFARSPPLSWPRAPPTPKKTKNEVDRWFLQRNGKGEKYFLNTSTWEWQIENDSGLPQEVHDPPLIVHDRVPCQ